MKFLSKSEIQKNHDFTLKLELKGKNMSEKVYNTVSDVFDESDGNIITFDEAVSNIEAGKDVNHVIYFKHDLYKEADEPDFFPGDFEMLHDDTVAFSEFCHYFDIITSKYDIIKMIYVLLSNKRTVVFGLELSKKEV